LSTTFVDFDYVSLAEIDLSANSIYPEGVYTLKIMKAEQKDRPVYVDGQKTEATKKVASFQFAITNHDTLNGRRLFDNFQPTQFSLKAMARIANATGVHQVPGTPLSEWLGELSIVQPEFRVKVQVQNQKDPNSGFKSDLVGPDGKAIPENRINWFEVMAA
jgi:hypothetical protein